MTQVGKKQKFLEQSVYIYIWEQIMIERNKNISWSDGKSTEKWNMKCELANNWINQSLTEFSDSETKKLEKKTSNI